MSAPSCPISYGQPIPGARVFHKGDPWKRPGILQDLISQIPRATDLRSAIHALNMMNNIIQMVNRGAPQVNNIRIPREPDQIMKGEDLNPHYQPLDWQETGRDYEHSKVYNPEDKTQYIEVKTLKLVYFYNPNTNYRLTYYSMTGRE
jgi:hypothetical protein